MKGEKEGQEEGGKEAGAVEEGSGAEKWSERERKERREIVSQ